MATLTDQLAQMEHGHFGTWQERIVLLPLSGSGTEDEFVLGNNTILFAEMEVVSGTPDTYRIRKNTTAAGAASPGTISIKATAAGVNARVRIIYL